MHLRNVAALLPFALLAACGGSGPEAEEPAAAASTPAAEASAPAEPAATETPAPAPSASEAAPSEAAVPAPALTPAAASTPAAPAAKIAVAAPASFAICRACHSVEAGKNGVGPTLFAIVGSKAGEVPGYAFSPALKNSGITWDRAALDTWLKSPMKMVPGTKMVMAVPDAGKRKEIIDYLETLK